MGRSYSITISARDQFTPAITTMRNAGNHFSKDLEGMQAKLDAIDKTKATLRLDTKEAKKNLLSLEKEYAAARKSGDQMVSEDLLEKLREANSEYQLARRNLSLLDKEARNTESSMARMGGAFSKMESRASMGSAKESFLGTLAASGAIKMGGELLSSIAGAYVGSAYGDIGSTMFSSVLSGIASGAAMGTMLGGAGAGTVTGGAIGAAAGGLNAATQIFGQEDDAFQGVVQEQYNGITQRRQEALTSGSLIASGRETDQIAFAKLLGGGGIAEDYLAWVRDTANATPFQYEDLTGMSRTLATYGYSPGEMQKALFQIGDTGAALGMSPQDMGMVATGLGRMKSSGKTTLEYLNLLQERGVDAIGMLGEALGATGEEVYDMVSKGLIPGAFAAERIADAMGKANFGAMEEMGQTYSGLLSTKEGLERDLKSAMGDGFNQTRVDGIQKQNAFLSGESGEVMKNAYRLMGTFQAELENQKEEALRLALTGVMSSEKFKTAEREGNAAKMGELLAEAEAKAEAAYRGGEGYLLYEEAEKNTVSRLQGALAEDWEHFGYEMGKEFTKGLAAAQGQEAIEKSRLSKERYFQGDADFEEWRIQNLGGTQEGWLRYQQEYRPGYACGLSYVPSNDYPARLHEGERVLTASEARGYRQGGVTVTVTGNSFEVRGEPDIDRIAQGIAQRVREAQMMS